MGALERDEPTLGVSREVLEFGVARYALLFPPEGVLPHKHVFGVQVTVRVYQLG